MKGKLTHTNEILVYLGEGYFVKYSASQAIALCNRRIACINIIYYIYPYIYIIYILILYIIYILEEKHFIRYYDCYMFLCLSGADEMLKSLETERNLYEMRQYIPLEHDVFGRDRKDIVEHWTEDKLDEWKSIQKICHFYLHYAIH